MRDGGYHGVITIDSDALAPAPAAAAAAAVNVANATCMPTPEPLQTHVATQFGGITLLDGATMWQVLLWHSTLAPSSLPPGVPLAMLAQPASPIADPVDPGRVVAGGLVDVAGKGIHQVYWRPSYRKFAVSMRACVPRCLLQSAACVFTDVIAVGDVQVPGNAGFQQVLRRHPTILSAMLGGMAQEAIGIAILTGDGAMAADGEDIGNAHPAPSAPAESAVQPMAQPAHPVSAQLAADDAAPPPPTSSIPPPQCCHWDESTNPANIYPALTAEESNLSALSIFPWSAFPGGNKVFGPTPNLADCGGLGAPSLANGWCCRDHWHAHIQAANILGALWGSEESQSPHEIMHFLACGCGWSFADAIKFTNQFIPQRFEPQVLEGTWASIAASHGVGCKLPAPIKSFKMLWETQEWVDKVVLLLKAELPTCGNAIPAQANATAAEVNVGPVPVASPALAPVPTTASSSPSQKRRRDDGNVGQGAEKKARSDEDQENVMCQAAGPAGTPAPDGTPAPAARLPSLKRQRADEEVRAVKRVRLGVRL
jgi:hypothetical protein